MDAIDILGAFGAGVLVGLIIGGFIHHHIVRKYKND